MSDQDHPTRTPSSADKPRVKILNQYYVPDVASTGQLLHSLAMELVKQGFEISALASMPSYGPPESRVPCPRRELLQGVQVRRVWTTRFGKDRALGRVLNLATYLIQVTLRMLFSKRDVVYLYVTNPPMLGAIGGLVSLVRRHRYVMLLYDAYPQIVVWMGKMRKGGLVDRVWQWFNKLAYRRAEQTIVLCQKAGELVCNTYGVDPARVHVIPNWADGELIQPKPKSESQLAGKYNLIDSFVVQYSGNLGLYYDFDTILGATEILKGESYKMVFIGAGGNKPYIQQQMEQRRLSNALLLPYQPYETLNDSMAACDAALVSIAPGIEGISFPSKLYTALATGRPILALSERKSELRDLVEKHDVGLWAEVGDVKELTRCIRQMMGNPQQCDEYGRRARQLFEARFTKELCTRQYAEVFHLAASKQPHARMLHPSESINGTTSRADG